MATHAADLYDWVTKHTAALSRDLPEDQQLQLYYYGPGINKMLVEIIAPHPGSDLMALDGHLNNEPCRVLVDARVGQLVFRKVSTARQPQNQRKPIGFTVRKDALSGGADSGT